jgi:hypothetical protein
MLVVAGMAMTAGLAAKTTPLAQDYALVFRNPDPEYYVAGIGMERLDDASYLAVMPVVPRSQWAARRPTRSHVAIVRTSDAGKTWQEISRLPYYSAVPWMHRGTLYLFANRGGTEFRGDDLLILSSADAGKSWSAPTLLLQGHFWNCHTNMVIQNDRLYWAIDDFSPAPTAGLRVVVGDLARDPMKLSSWRFSETCRFPGLPNALANPNLPPGKSNLTEANVIAHQGKIRVLATVQANGLTTSGLAAVLDVADDGDKVSLAFNQYYPAPGGQHKRGIVWDPESRLFWATGNLPVDSQESYPWWEEGRARGSFMGGGGNERRFLMLFYSADGLNWFQAGCIAQAARISQSFMYARPIVEGNDLVVLSRSSIDAPNQHDADCATFHRVRNFRDLALNLFPDPERP